MARKKQTSTDLSAQYAALIEFAIKALNSAARLGVKQKTIRDFPLDPAERAIVADLPGLSVTLKKKLAKTNGTFTVADTARIVVDLANALLEGEPLQQVALLSISKKLTDCLEVNLVPAVPTKVVSKGTKPTGTVYQFKISLVGFEPPIWRRIQIVDCTLDKLHEHIQTAMGWTNDHLHQFNIKGTRYGNPEMLDGGFGDIDCVDSTRIYLSQIMPGGGSQFVFSYVYDFGDGWEHKVLLESSPPVDPKAKYPICLEGERACPPEDCGGVWGYAELLEAIRDPKHEEHEDMLDWIGDSFDPEAFDPKRATKEMRKGLPDWRSME